MLAPTLPGRRTTLIKAPDVRLGQMCKGGCMAFLQPENIKQDLHMGLDIEGRSHLSA